MSRPVLLAIDVHERRFHAMDVERRDDMIRNLGSLATAPTQRLGLALIVLGRADTDVFREVATLRR